MTDRGRQVVAMLLATACVVVPAAIALGLSVLGVGGGASWSAACVAGVALGAAWYLWDRYPIPLIVVPIASAFAPLLILGFVVDPAILVSGIMPRVTLEAATSASRSVVAIEDARVETSLAGRYEADSNPGRPARKYVAAPLAPARQVGYAPGAAWVICEGDGAGCAEAFTRSPLVGVVRAHVAADDVPGGGAIDDAIATHGLEKQAQLVVLSIDANPMLEAAIPILAGGFGMLFFIALVLLVTRARGRARRGARPIGG